MAQGLNRVTLLGNLGQNPELRYTQAGSPVLSFRLATTESVLNRDKEREDRTEWHSVSLWGKRAEALAKFLTKGSQLCVEGRLQTRSWEAADGSKRYATEVVAKNILLLGGKRNGRAGDSSHSEPPPPPATEDDFGDQDIPF